MNFLLKVIFILLCGSVEQLYFFFGLWPSVIITKKNKMRSVRVAQRYHYQTENCRNSRFTRWFLESGITVDFCIYTLILQWRIAVGKAMNS